MEVNVTVVPLKMVEEGLTAKLGAVTGVGWAGGKLKRQTKYCRYDNHCLLITQLVLKNAPLIYTYISIPTHICYFLNVMKQNERTNSFNIRLDVY